MDGRGGADEASKRSLSGVHAVDSGRNQSCGTSEGRGESAAGDDAKPAKVGRQLGEPDRRPMQLQLRTATNIAQFLGKYAPAPCCSGCIK